MTFHKSSFYTLIIIVVAVLSVFIGGQTFYHYKKDEVPVKCQIVFANIVDFSTGEHFLNEPITCHNGDIINNNPFDLNTSLIFTSDSYSGSAFPHSTYGNSIEELKNYNPLNKAKSWVITIHIDDDKDYQFVVHGATLKKDFTDTHRIVWLDDNPIIFPGGITVDIQ